MTAVGKILVFFNLIFSIIISAMVVLVYTTRTDWRTTYEGFEREARAIEQEYLDDVELKNKQIAARDDQIKQLQEDIGIVKGERDALDLKITEKEVGYEDRLAAANALYEAELAKVENLRTEQKLLEQERKNLQALNQKQRGDIVMLVEQKNELEKLKVTAELARDSVQEKNEKLIEALARSEQLRRNVEFKLNTIGGSGALASSSGSVLDPERPEVPGNIEGKITYARNGLLQISVGSDAGVAKGAVLDVFRLDLKDPKASRYYGTLRITDTESKKAVGKFIPFPGMKDRPAVGDTVGKLTDSGGL